MATRKPDSEVGPLGVWAYNTARLLGLTPEQVAVRAGVTEPTIRKIEGGSSRRPSPRVIYEMARYFREVAAVQGGVTVSDPPGMPERPGASDGPGLSDLVTAIQSLVDELRLSRLSEPLSIEDQIAAAERSLDELRSRRLLPPADQTADGAGPRPSTSRGELVAAGGRKGTPA